MSIPIIESAKKRLRQNKKRAKLNKERKNALKEVTKQMDRLLEEGKKEEAQELLPDLMSLADKAAGKGPFHKNKAARIKSKYTRKVQALSGS